MTRRGALIVMEGCDRSGKSTQCRKLIESLSQDGKRVELIKFPDRTTTIGRMISDYLTKETNINDAAIHLLFSANRWELLPQIEKKLDSGVTLIVDRYAYSGVAYTSSKPGFTLDWCKQSDAGLPRPDAVIYLDMSADVAKKRGNYGDERYETATFQKKVAETFTRLREHYWTVIDADQSIDDLHREILNNISATLDSDLPHPIPRLWLSDKPCPAITKQHVSIMT